MQPAAKREARPHENPSGNARVRRGPAPGLRRVLYYLLFIAAIVSVPLFIFRPSETGSNYYLTVLIYVGINTILAVGLNLLMGYAGQVSLGHAAFYGIGAYTSAILSTRGQSPWVGMAAGIALACAVAYLLGRKALRLHGHYLAMATLGFGIIASIIFLEWVGLTGGTSGIYGIPNLEVAGRAVSTDISMYALVWALVVLVIALSDNIVNSRVGRAFQAVHGSEIAASTLGVDVARYKLQVLVLSAALAALAGSLYAHYVTFISPEPFGFKFSVQLVVMVVVGGMASIWGAIFGAGMVTILGEVLRGLGHATIGGRSINLSDFEVVVFGLILMLIMIYLPAGLVRGVVDSARVAARLARRGKGGKR
jgi:branched-chain amino acid transport system permease protein